MYYVLRLYHNYPCYFEFWLHMWTSLVKPSYDLESMSGRHILITTKLYMANSFTKTAQNTLNWQG